MAVTVHLPGPLTAFAGGRGRVELETAGRVRDVLAALWALHPAVRDRVMTEAGVVRPHVNVFVGSESIRYTGGLETPVAEGAEVFIIAAVSGGRGDPLRQQLVPLGAGVPLEAAPALLAPGGRRAKLDLGEGEPGFQGEAHEAGASGLRGQGLQARGRAGVAGVEGAALGS